MALLPSARLRVLQYIVLVLITFLTQVAIGAYMLNIDMSSLRTSWEQDDAEGQARRDQLQVYLTCCGSETCTETAALCVQSLWLGVLRTCVDSQLSVACFPLSPSHSFDTWSDSLGTLHTSCPYLPTPMNGFKEPQACFPAAKKFVRAWLGPVATGAIVIGCIEVSTPPEGEQ